MPRLQPSSRREGAISATHLFQFSREEHPPLPTLSDWNPLLGAANPASITRWSLSFPKADLRLCTTHIDPRALARELLAPDTDDRHRAMRARRPASTVTCRSAGRDRSRSPLRPRPRALCRHRFLCRMGKHPAASAMAQAQAHHSRGVLHPCQARSTKPRLQRAFARRSPAPCHRRPRRTSADRESTFSTLGERNFRRVPPPLRLGTGWAKRPRPMTAALCWLLRP